MIRSWVHLLLRRVYSGTVSTSATVMNSVKEKKRTSWSYVQMHSNDREDIKERVPVILLLCWS